MGQGNFCTIFSACSAWNLASSLLSFAFPSGVVGIIKNTSISSIPAECEDSVRLEQFYVAGNLADFEKLLKAPYQNEYYVTRNQIAAYESHEIDDICDYLTAHEVLELPYTARSEYVLYRWNDVFDNAEKIRSMVDRLRFQVECFNEALPYEAGQSYGDRAASQVRVIYRIS